MLLDGSVLWLTCLLALTHATYNEDISSYRAEDGDSEQSDVIRRKRSDVVSISALQAVIQQQADVVQQLQAQMTALQVDLTSTKSDLANIRQSLPSTFSPVAFSVRFAHDSQAGLGLSPHATLVFDTAITNIGNAYNVHTGIFTAPVAGVYSFYINFMSPNGHSHTYIAIVKDGDLLDYAYANGGDDHDQGSTEVVVHLATGQQVWARLDHDGDAVRGDRFTIFTGHLVQAD